MSFRKEKKFKLTKYEFDLLKSNLFNRGMQPLYAQRTINSLYYDTAMLDCFYHSEEGILPRKKYRIRWYKLISESSIETKTSSIEGRFKTTDNGSFIAQESLPKTVFDRAYGALTPSLLVTYEREYFSLEGMRLTFDTSIKYVNYRHSQDVVWDDEERVMEIKVPENIADDFIESVIPYSTARFSKYCRGLLISRGEM